MMKILGFFLGYGLALAFTTLWFPALEAIWGYERGLGFIHIFLFFTVLVLVGETYYWQLAWGRALIFCGGFGFVGNFLSVLLSDAPAAGMFVAGIAFMLGYPLSRYRPKENPYAISDLVVFSPHLKGFHDFYEEKLKAYLHSLEEERRISVKRRWIGYCLGLPLIFFLYVAFDKLLLPDSDGFDVIRVFIFLFAFFMGYAMIGGRALMLQKSLKESLITKTCAYFKTLHYQEKKDEYDPEPFCDAGLVSREYDQKCFNDFLLGKHKGIDFVINGASLSEKKQQEAWFKGKNRRKRGFSFFILGVGYNVPYRFEGVMARFTFPRPFEGHTLILEDRGVLNKTFKPPPGMKRVNLVIDKFERHFEVFSDDQVAARAVLTPDVMENLIKLGLVIQGYRYDLYNQRDALAPAGGKMAFAFKGNQLLMTIESNRKYLEVGNLDASMFDATRIALFVRQIGLAYEVIDTLSLKV